MVSYKERLKDITSFIFDVDGVLTDGKVLLYHGEILRELYAKDGYAIQYASKMGYGIYIITGGNSLDVKNKLLEIGAKDVFLKSSHKLQVYEELKNKYALTDGEILYMGDDVPDYQVMSKVHIAACPQDAIPEIKEISHYQSPLKGGLGCVRDVIEQTLKVQGKWMTDLAFAW